MDAEKHLDPAAMPIFLLTARLILLNSSIFEKNRSEKREKIYLHGEAFG